MRDFCRQSSNVYLFDFCYGIPLRVFGQKIFYILADFDQNFIFRTQHISIFHLIALLLRTK